MAGTPLHVVDTVAALEQMAADLAGARHIAIDLEAHSYRCVERQWQLHTAEVVDMALVLVHAHEGCTLH